MDNTPDPSTLLDNMMSSLGTINEPSKATLCPKDSTKVYVRKLVLDHIYGLLSQEELTEQQINLLDVLLKASNS